MPTPNEGAAQPAQAQQSTTPEALSADDIKSLIAEQVRAALDPKALSSALSPVVNAAVTNHLKRTAGAQQPAQGEQQSQQQQPSGQESRALQELAALREQLEAEKRSRIETERRSTLDSARRAMTEALAQKGITGAKARAIVADLSASGAFKLGDDGTPVLTVSRARVKGSKPSALEYTDLAEAIGDWVQGDEAKEFLPAPSGGVAPPAGRGGARLPVGAKPPAFDLNSEDGAVTAALHLLDND
jgi:hypothetical protein